MKQELNLSSVELVALAKAVGDKDLKAARNEIGEGTYPVNFTVAVNGMLKVGADTTSLYPNKIDWMGLFAVALSKLNMQTRDAIVDFYNEAQEITQRDFKKEVEEILKELVGETEQPRKGNVTAALEVEKVNQQLELFQVA